MDFFPEIDINATQAEAIARGLYAVARSTAVHEREVALISEFFHDGRPGRRKTTARAPPRPRWPGSARSSPRAVAPLLPGDAAARAVREGGLPRCLGRRQVSAAERAKIGEFAQGAGGVAARARDARGRR